MEVTIENASPLVFKAYKWMDTKQLGKKRKKK
jgi:hypothetical protein